MPISNVAICNMALSLLGDSSIMSLTDNSERARQCNLRFEQIRNAVLRAHPWNFALKRAELAELETVPAFDWAKEFQLPDDCLRVTRLGTYDEEFVIEGRKLLTDATTAKIRYIARVENPAEYDALFCEAFAARLASDLCQKISGNSSRADALWAQYERKLQEAQGVDGQEGSDENLTSDVFITARF